MTNVENENKSFQFWKPLHSKCVSSWIPFKKMFWWKIIKGNWHKEQSVMLSLLEPYVSTMFIIRLHTFALCNNLEMQFNSAHTYLYCFVVLSPYQKQWPLSDIQYLLSWAHVLVLHQFLPRWWTLAMSDQTYQTKDISKQS